MISLYVDNKLFCHCYQKYDELNIPTRSPRGRIKVPDEVVGIIGNTYNFKARDEVGDVFLFKGLLQRSEYGENYIEIVSDIKEEL